MVSVNNIFHIRYASVISYNTEEVMIAAAYFVWMIVLIMESVTVVENANVHHNLEEKIVAFYNYHLSMDRDYIWNLFLFISLLD